MLLSYSSRRKLMQKVKGCYWRRVLRPRAGAGGPGSTFCRLTQLTFNPRSAEALCLFPFYR